MSDTAEKLRSFNADLREYVEQAPEIQRFQEFIDAAEETDALDHKTKELMALAIGVAERCEPCILWHTDAALKAGATTEEVDDALKVAVVMGGGPALAYAAHAHQACVDLAE